MSGLFFAFEGFDSEIEKKLASLDAGSDALVADYLAMVGKAGLTGQGMTRIKKLCERLLALPSTTEYAEYLTHPIRVSASYAAFLPEPSFDDLALSLCHNAIEMGIYGALEEEFLSPLVRADVKRLTIDRARERDREYLDRYYDGIENGSSTLMVLKALDKLDNTLWWAQFDIEQHDSDVVLNYVCPRVARIDRRLADYLEGLTRYVLRREIKARYANDPRGIAALARQR